METTRNVLCSFQADPEKIDAYIRSKNPEIAVNEHLLRIYARAVIQIASGQVNSMNDEELVAAMSICRVPVMSFAEFLKANEPQRAEVDVPSAGPTAGESQAV